MSTRITESNRFVLALALLSSGLWLISCGDMTTPPGSGMTVTLSGCPSSLPQGGTLSITAMTTDAGGNDVTANASYTYVVTQGGTSIGVSGQGNVASADIPDDAQLGAYVLEVTATLDGASDTAECRFNVFEGDGSGYNNTTDRTNAGATYLGSASCRACHPNIDATQTVHGHGHKLTPIQGQAPTFPVEGDRAGVPDPPEGFSWNDIAYVIGGYTRKARYIDHDGFILTNDSDDVDPQWNLVFPPNGVVPGFVPYENKGKFSPEFRKPYGYSCFVCHTTGPQPQDEDDPEFQENRPGFMGTWVEAGVQCESCHGPGSNHVANPEARDIFVDISARACGECHNRPFNAAGDVILASSGYIKHHEQFPELLASGGHAEFNCVTCHDPHISTNYDLDNALRNVCTDCHTEQGMALHGGKTFVRGDYVEELTCVSCHMPFATRSAATASAATVGELGRMGDTKTHIFRINTEPVDYTRMFNEDGSEVIKDTVGRAAVTVDFVCLRCHNGVGNAFDLTLESAGSIADDIHSAGQ